MQRKMNRHARILLTMILSLIVGISHLQAQDDENAGAGIAVDGLSVTKSVKNSMQYFPGTEDLTGLDEMRITFMGSAPLTRIGQSGMSILVELGDGKSFIFDMGPGSIHNYLAMGYSFPEINDIFITHLHADHWLDVLYTLPFGAWGGRYEALRIYGPSGREDDDGIGYWANHIQKAMNWHIEAFNVVPIGDGLNMDVQKLATGGLGITEGSLTGNVIEFPWFPETTDAGVCGFYTSDEPNYSKFKPYCGRVYKSEDGKVEISYWAASHAKDGAVSYRLDWTTPSGEKLSFAYTGDTRPTEYMREFAKGVDFLVSECQAESLQVSAQSWGFPVELAMFTVDTHHTPALAAGELFQRTGTRVGVCSHITWDHNLINEVAAEVRATFDGLFLWGAPDRVVFNVDPANIWTREAVAPEYASQPAAKYDAPLECLPVPRHHRSELQCEALRTYEVDKKLYYVQDTDRDLILEFPPDLPADEVPPGFDYCAAGTPGPEVPDTCIQPLPPAQ